jgi:hypothetical protein
VTDDQQLFPVPADRLWAALGAALKRPQTTNWKMQHLDKTLRRIEMSSGMTAMTWGQNVVIQVEPAADGGSLLRLSGAGKFPSLRDRARIKAMASDLVRRVSAELKQGKTLTTRPEGD